MIVLEPPRLPSLPRQFSLARLLAFVTVCGLVFSLFRYVEPDMAIGILLVAFLSWPLIRYTDWPDIMRFVGAIAVIVFVIGLIVSGCVAGLESFSH
jgi:hypothetical protein